MGTKDEDTIDFNHDRIESLREIEPVGKSITKICLRQNRITRIDALDCFGRLLELDLYDNGVTEIENLNSCSNLKILDLSFNKIRKIQNLEELNGLETLFLASNKITSIGDGLKDLTELRVLELGANEISVLRSWIRNRIATISGLSSLCNLRILALQSNSIRHLSGFECLSNLEELYVSDNRITAIEGLEKNTKLRILDVGNNQISQIGDISHLVELQEFWAGGNKLESFEELKSLVPCPKLVAVYLDNNPWCSNPRYVAIIREKLPYLTQIDAAILRWE